jgi:hypothetical protein
MRMSMGPSAAPSPGRVPVLTRSTSAHTPPVLRVAGRDAVTLKLLPTSASTTPQDTCLCAHLLCTAYGCWVHAHVYGPVSSKAEATLSYIQLQKQARNSSQRKSRTPGGRVVSSTSKALSDQLARPTVTDTLIAHPPPPPGGGGGRGHRCSFN